MRVVFFDAAILQGNFMDSSVAGRSVCVRTSSARRHWETSEDRKEKAWHLLLLAMHLLLLAMPCHV